MKIGGFRITPISEPIQRQMNSKSNKTRKGRNELTKMDYLSQLNTLLSLIYLFIFIPSTLCYEQEAIVKGGTMTFGCPAKAGVVQRWQENGLALGDSEAGLDSELKDKSLAVGSTEWFNLTLLSTKMEDSGTFVCQGKEGEDWVTQTRYNLTVLEAPICMNLTSLTVDSGESLEVSCVSEIPGVTLIWHVGVEGERSVGAKKAGLPDRYDTSLHVTASPSLNKKFVYCELQHPSWHVLDGIIDCKVGPVSVRSSKFQIRCHLTADSPSSPSASVSCSITSNSPTHLSAETVSWQGSYDGKVFDTLELLQNLRQTEEGSWETQVVLDGELRQSLTAVRIQAGDVIGEPVELSPSHVATSHLTTVIVMVILIIVAFLIFFIVVILYRQGHIFKPQQTSEVEMDKRALTRPTQSQVAEEIRLLTNIGAGTETHQIEGEETVASAAQNDTINFKV